MSAPVCCGGLTMQPDSFTRHQNGRRPGQQTTERCTIGYKCSQCSKQVRLAEPIVVAVKVGWS